MKIFDTFVGTMAGALVSVLCFGSACWIVEYYTNSGTVAGAYFAAMVGGSAGLLIGLPLGLVLSLLKRGRILGTLFGLIGGVVLLALVGIEPRSPDWDPRGGALWAAFLPAGALAGFLTSLVVLAFSKLNSSGDTDQCL